MAHELPYLAAVALVVLAMVALGVRRRILLRVAVRNVGRRKTQVVLAVAGLLVATSILSGSFVIGDSLNFAIRESVFRGLDVVDEVVVLGGEEGTGQFFPVAVYEDLAARRDAMASVDGLGPRILVRASVLHPDAELFEGRALLIGFDAAVDPGVFVRGDGRATDGGELGDGQTFLSAELAEEIEAAPGDVVRVFVGPAPTEFEVLDVLRAEGKGAWRNAPVLFVPLAAAQALLGVPGQINQIVVSNVGGVEDGAAATDDAVAQIHDALGDGHPYTIRDVKRDALADADAESDELTQLFALLGTFTVIAGLMLIVSIFAMLAEERKTEMGIQRAIGLRRGHLTELFTLEGFLYALASAAMGAVAGLLVAAVVLYAIGQIFAGADVTLTLRWQASSLVLGFALGFLLTIGTIAFAAGRISKLNIVRAVRNLPEPIVRRTTRGQAALGLAVLVLGVLAVVVGYDQRRAVLFLPGFAVAALGLAQLAHRRLGARAAFSAGGAFTVAWLVTSFRPFPEIRPDIDLFIATGVLLVLGGVLLVVFNNEVLLAIVPRLAGRRRRLQPVLRTAIAYPMNRRFRTGLTIAIFALVIFTIVVMASIQALIGVSIAGITRDASGGYEVFGITNPRIPAVGFDARLAEADVADAIAYYEAVWFAPAEVTPPQGDVLFYELYGIDDAFAERNGFTFFQRADRFATDRDVWREVLANPAVAVVDRNVQPVDFGPQVTDMRLAVGDRVVLRNATGGTRTVEIVGILNSQAVRGLFVQADVVRDAFGTVAPSFFLFRLAPGADADAVAKDLERTFLPWQMQTVVIESVIAENLDVVSAFFDLLQGYLAMGLFVGIAGLGIVTMRNVVERRQEMGALRALGFRRSMILQSLLVEISYVALLGIGLGVVLGVLLSYRIYLDFLVTADAFVVPWAKIALVALVAYAMSLLTTASPAIRAARLPPAEALRYVE
jgi:putative ABC transport system permease protein